MKGFLATLFVICGLLAAGYFLYDPVVKPLLEGEGGEGLSFSRGETESGVPAEPTDETATPEKALPAKPVSYKTEPDDPDEVEKSEVDLFLEERYPMPDILPLMVIVDNWNAVPARAYPEEVTAKETVAFDLEVNGEKIGSSNVPPGTPLKPVRLVGDQLTVASLANPAMNRSIQVDKTDFKDRITQRYEEFVTMRQNEVATARAKAKQAIEANPNLMAKLAGGDATPAVSADDPKFGPVKASLRNGEVASVTLEEATDFTWNGTEQIGGDYEGTYETVTVRFEVDTIFGTFPTVYKCLIEGGRVVAWIDPVTEDRV
ncbi:MAG: hypothetical protein WD342_18090 [Verrucomicrobiales bacterium]